MDISIEARVNNAPSGAAYWHRYHGSAELGRCRILGVPAV